LTVFTVNSAPGAPFPVILLLALFGSVVAAIAGGAWLEKRRTGKLNLRVSRIFILCVIGAVLAVVAFDLRKAGVKRDGLIERLASGQYEHVEGTVSAVEIVNRPRGRVIFSIGGERFWFPYHAPAACWPQIGEAARVSFVRAEPASSFMGIENDVLKLELTRGCPGGRWQ